MASTRRLHAALVFPLLAVVGCLSSASSATDGGAPDASTQGDDGAVAPGDAGVVPPADGTTSTCAPASVASYVPKWTPPKAPQAACTKGQITAYAACIASGNPGSAACAPLADSGANAACLSCVATSTGTDPSWGPLVLIAGSDLQINISGCLAIETGDTGSGCAGNFQALQECEAAACAANCQGQASSALALCTSQADNAGCSNYLAPAACVSDAGTGTSACISASGSFADKLAAVTSVFCLAAGDGG
jgi:hypothetical protein